MNQWLQQLCHSATPSIDECVQQLGSVIPWLNDLKKTPQDPGWHAEGDVHIHTGMVLNQLYQLLANEAAYLNGQQRRILEERPSTQRGGCRAQGRRAGAMEKGLWLSSALDS